MKYYNSKQELAARLCLLFLISPDEPLYAEELWAESQTMRFKMMLQASKMAAK